MPQLKPKIHIIIGGTHSGKTTYVLERYCKEGARPGRLAGVPLTVCGSALMVGNYLRAKEKRTVGVDELGRDYKLARARVLKLIEAQPWVRENDVLVMEGNALCCRIFLEKLAKSADIKLTLLMPPIDALRARFANGGQYYGWNIAKLTYQRALRAYYGAESPRIEREMLG